jgi:transposase InsO family protein
VEKGFVYLAVIMDLFSRKIIGWSLDTIMTTQLIIDVFNMAVASRKVEPALILHLTEVFSITQGNTRRYCSMRVYGLV